MQLVLDVTVSINSSENLKQILLYSQKYRYMSIAIPPPSQKSTKIFSPMSVSERSQF